MKTEPTQDFYEALVRRDGKYDGVVYYGVRTTGVYCRPTCKSRTPLRKNVEFFDSTADAERASYRACKRCKPDSVQPEVDERLVRVCREIESAEEAPLLRDLAKLVHMSEFHLQRRFKAARGVSPRQYADMVKRSRLRTALQNGQSVTAAIYDAGFASASQAYDASRRSLGMTPSQFRDGGKNTTVTFAIVGSPLGRILVAATSRGICRVDIGDDDRELERRLRAEYPKASVRREDDTLESTVSLIVDYLSGTAPWPHLPIDVRATAFQSRVWEALRSIAPGSTMTYSQLAEAIGSPHAARAVARACASNPVALLIPCHRIVPQGGGVGGYRWNPARKERLLELERTSA